MGGRHARRAAVSAFVVRYVLQHQITCSSSVFCATIARTFRVWQRHYLGLLDVRGDSAVAHEVLVEQLVVQPMHPQHLRESAAPLAFGLPLPHSPSPLRGSCCPTMFSHGAASSTCATHLHDRPYVYDRHRKKAIGFCLAVRLLSDFVPKERRVHRCSHTITPISSSQAESWPEGSSSPNSSRPEMRKPRHIVVGGHLEKEPPFDVFTTPHRPCTLVGSSFGLLLSASVWSLPLASGAVPLGASVAFALSKAACNSGSTA